MGARENKLKFHSVSYRHRRKEYKLRAIQPIRRVIEPIQRRPARCEQQVWVPETVGHDPPAWGRGVAVSVSVGT